MARRPKRRFLPICLAAALPAPARAHQARPAKRRRQIGRFERLEDRLAMDGAGMLVDDSPLDQNSDVALISDQYLPQTNQQPDLSDELPTRFASQAEFEAWFTEAAIAQWGHLFGQPTSSNNYWYDYDYRLDGLSRVILFNDAVAQPAGVLGADLLHSSTNVQVEGVDEADFVETDGEYLYILTGDELVIVEAGTGEDLRIASRIHLDGRAVGMYLAGDRLAIVSSSESPGNFGAAVAGRVQIWGSGQNYYNGYGFEKTTVTMLDVSDRSAPALVQKSEMDGRLVTSRVVDGELRLVLTSAIDLPMPLAKPVDGTAPSAVTPGLRFAPAPIESIHWLIDDAIAFDDISYYSPPENDAVYETQEEYLARIKADLFESVLPGLRILDVDGSVLDGRSLFPVTDLYRPESPHDRDMTVVATFDLNSNTAGPVDTAAVVTAGASQVYMSEGSLYLFSPDVARSSSGWWIRGSGTSTMIRKFDFDADSHEVSLAARGRVEGTLLNQFAADEYNGDLRVVTTGDWDSHQNLFVLRQVGQKLKVIGDIDQIAPGERLHSVRFMGDRAFVVTFRQVDPLFAIDLSDPTDPEILAELKIPGVSGYLQPLDENHLIGVGRAMDESGMMFSDLEVSIFGVEDLSNPQLLHKFAFEGGWSTTTPVLGSSWIPFTGDSHAMALFPEEQILALPVFSTEGGNLDGVASLPHFEPGHGGLQLFRIDVETGLTPLAFLEHETLIERAIKIDDYLFAISSGTISVHALSDPMTALGTLELSGDDENFTPLVALKPLPTATSLPTLTLATEPPEEPYTAPTELATFSEPMQVVALPAAAFDLAAAARTGAVVSSRHRLATPAWASVRPQRSLDALNLSSLAAFRASSLESATERLFAELESSEEGDRSLADVAFVGIAADLVSSVEI